MNGSVLVAILDASRNKILLTKRRDIPVWVFPGGHTEDEESLEACAVREVREETGYEVTIVRKIAEYRPRNRLSKFTHFFEARVTSGEAIITDETQEIGWFDVDALPYPLPPPYEVLTEHAVTAAAIRQEEMPNSSYWILLKSLFKRPDLIFRFLAMKCGLHINI